jgi:hypothetical protein
MGGAGFGGCCNRVFRSHPDGFGASKYVKEKKERRRESDKCRAFVWEMGAHDNTLFD